MQIDDTVQLAYDTRNIMTAPPSPASPNATSGDEEEEEPSSNWDSSHFEQGEASDDVFLFDQLEACNDQRPSLNQQPPHLLSDFEVGGDIKMKYDLFPNPPLAEFFQRPEDEEALLTTNCCDENSPLGILTSTSSLEDRLKLYKQPMIADDESDTSSMDKSVSSLDSHTPFNHAQVHQEEESDDAYEPFHDVDGDEDPTRQEFIPAESHSTRPDSQECVSSVQLVIDRDDQESSISLNPIDRIEASHQEVIHSTKSIPLLKPPPPEKLAKWLMSKPSLMSQASSSVPQQGEESFKS